jgi:hypothetical protein
MFEQKYECYTCRFNVLLMCKSGGEKIYELYPEPRIQNCSIIDRV